jgi:hypothetical protein
MATPRGAKEHYHIFFFKPTYCISNEISKPAKRFTSVIMANHIFLFFKNYESQNIISWYRKQQPKISNRHTFSKAYNTEGRT